MKPPKRDHLLDNYKGILITLVVVGHFIEVASDDNLFLYGLKWLIFSFHMPAFVFISGYFSKRIYSLPELLRKLAAPYLIFEVLYYILYHFIGKDTELWLLYPKFSLWYLMAMFVWKLATPWIRRIPGHLLLSVAAGLAVGASSLDDNFLTLPRMIVFYPFFLLGVHFDREWFSLMRKRISRRAAGLAILAINLLLLWTALGSSLSPKIFYGRYDYEYLDMTIPQGVAIRLACYFLAFLMTLLVIILLPDQPTPLSGLGSRTMAVYLFHGLVYSCFKQGKAFYNSLGDLPETILILAVSLAVTWLLSRRIFTDIIRKITG